MKRSKNKATLGARIIQGLQEFAEALEKKEPLAGRFRCRSVRLDLRSAAYDAKRVQETRGLLGVDQAVFAQFLGVSVRTVRTWEQGVATPSDIACRFMDEIRHDPEHWIARLKQATIAM